MNTNLHVRKVIAISTFALMAGCASPTVVQERQAGDQALSCDQLIQAIDEARNFERKARGERGATGTNVAAALFFWPGMIATYSNTGDAIEAAQERQRYLTKLYDGKSCDQAKLATAASAAPAMPAAAPVSAADTYTVTAISGAPAFAESNGQGVPLHNFANGAVLTVIETTPDSRWYKVLIPDGRTGYVPSAIVQVAKAAVTSAASKDEPKSDKEKSNKK